jgi:putative colanic acid biosynthesis acetyltransferase WcaF
MHGWRRFILRIFGANIGKHCHVYPKVEIWAPWNLKLDDYASIADGCNVYSIDKISLGKKAVVSQGSYLCTGSHDYNSSNFQLIASPISIGANSWIAAQAFIGPGVTIGESAVIGARAVVTCDVAARMVCAGNPCRVIKQRECG